jgi:two-component system OmpR family response regulator
VRHGGDASQGRRLFGKPIKRALDGSVAVSAILIVLEDSSLRRQISDYLTSSGLDTYKASDGREVAAALRKGALGLVILDAQLPDGSSLALCRRLAEAGGPPVILMGAAQDAIERIVGLEVGAEDYVAKTIHLRELLARVRVAMRRRPAFKAEPSPVFASRGLELDLLHRQLKAPGREPLRLTPAEASVLALFIEREGEPVSRADLKEATLRDHHTASDGSVDTQISRLRRKLTAYAGVELIQTIHGVGYVWNAVFGATRVGAGAETAAHTGHAKVRAV